GSEEMVFRVGSVPLPPYIHQKLADAERYQTVFNQSPGSAAAPTAGLHFTPEVISALHGKGVKTAFVTLNVGLDTFRPLTVDDAAEHQMHGEECSISPETATLVNDCPGRVIAVGTTTTRTLESHAVARRKIEPGSQHTHIFINPGYDFKVIDGLLTNFHMPRTTMLLMLSALVGSKNLMNGYAEAVQHEYRFLSFGDAMLIL
ncbi:MAG: S-adenosylmethionine:tRNA ribosyltransferase-isomerase, partial [Armatimonadota bacterium]